MSRPHTSKFLLTFCLMIIVGSITNAQLKYYTCNFENYMEECPCLLGMGHKEGADNLLSKNATYDYPATAEKMPGNKKIVALNFDVADRQDIQLLSWEKLRKDMTAKDKERYPKIKYYKDASYERTAEDQFDFHGSKIDVTIT